MFTVMDNKTIKMQAKGVLKNSRPSPVLVTVIFLAVLLVFAVLRMSLSGMLDAAVWDQYYEYAMAGDYQTALEYIYSIEPSGFSTIVIYAINFVTYVLFAGYIIFIMNSVRRTEPTIYNLLDGFGHFLKVIIVNLLRSIIVYVLSILLVVPGIIASYTYRLALFILLDNPDIRIIDAMSLSRIMMKGHKMEVFKLDLSFIGYILLSLIFPPVLIYLMPYMYSSWVIYYDGLKAAQFPQGDLLDNPPDKFDSDDDQRSDTE